MMKRALLIGINYTNIPGDTLNGCIDDIVNVYNVLTTQYGYDPTNIVMLRDDSSDPTLQPTKANILQNIQQLVTDSANCTDIWFHYSGHGSLINNGTTGVIVPVDYMSKGFITDDDMMTIFQYIKCTAMIMFDSCNSGAVCDLQWNYEFLYGNSFQRTQMDFPAIENPNIFMISGSKINQQSADAFDTKANQYEGVFTDAVLNTLASNNYTVTLGNLMQGICIWLVQNGITEQKPMLSASSDTPRWAISPAAV
jgi:Caspase domain